MKIYQTDLLTDPSKFPFSKFEKDLIYNGLDCMIQHELGFSVLPGWFNNMTRQTYELSKDLLGPILEMNMRGVLIDVEYRNNLLTEYKREQARMEQRFRRIVEEGIGIRPFNYRSNPTLIRLFYERLAIPPIRKRNDQGELVPTVNRDALERLQDYLYAQPIVNHLIELRTLDKKQAFLETGIDSDGRIRTSYNVGGTSIGRLSSSFSDFGTGTNLQNVEQRLRRVFIADPGYKFCNVDLEQSDSRGLGAIQWNIFADAKYLDACESGDLHTSVAKLVWPNLGWTNEPRRDREIADRPFYRQHSRRHMTKVLGHGTNFLGQPAEMSRHTKIPLSDIAEFQGKYFAAFPAHPRWHQWVRDTILRDGYLVSLFGRQRYFLGRRSDPETIRKAVAFEPASITADTLNYALRRVSKDRRFVLLLQVHDSLLVQYPERMEHELIPALLGYMKTEHELRGGRKFYIPAEAKVGWNWADADDIIDGKSVRTNPDGLVKWTGNDTRTRSRTPEAPKLDRRLFGANLRVSSGGTLEEMGSDNGSWGGN